MIHDQYFTKKTTTTTTKTSKRVIFGYAETFNTLHQELEYFRMINL